MALLTAAIGSPSPICGGSQRPYGSFDKSAPPAARYSERGPLALTQRRYGSFLRTLSTSDAKTVADRYVPKVTFEYFGDVDSLVSDVYVPRLAMSTVMNVGRATSDTYLPVLNMAVQSLTASGTVAKNVADRYVPVVTMFAPLPVPSVMAVADQYVPRLTLTATVSKAGEIVVSDLYVLNLAMDVVSMVKVEGRIDVSASDVYAPVLFMSAAIGSAGDVDDIDMTDAPYGIIEISDT